MDPSSLIEFISVLAPMTAKKIAQYIAQGGKLSTQEMTVALLAITAEQASEYGARLSTLEERVARIENCMCQISESMAILLNRTTSPWQVSSQEKSLPGIGKVNS
jgi:hypothetical protein